MGVHIAYQKVSKGKKEQKIDLPGGCTHIYSDFAPCGWITGTSGSLPLSVVCGCFHVRLLDLALARAVWRGDSRWRGTRGDRVCHFCRRELLAS